MKRDGFSLLDQMMGMAMIAIVVFLSVEVMNQLTKTSHKKENEYLQAIATTPTSQALWRYLSSADLKTYAFSSNTTQSIAYRLWIPLQNLGTDLSSSPERTTWITAKNGQIQSQSVPVLCTEKQGTQWYAFIPLWDMGKGAIEYTPTTLQRTGGTQVKPNRIDQNRTWSFIHEGSSYLFRISGSAQVYRWAQDTTTGVVSLAEGDPGTFPTLPQSCLGKGRIEQNGLTPTQAPLYPILNSLTTRMYVLPIEPLVFGNLVEDSSIQYSLSAGERVLAGYKGDASETELISLGTDSDARFRIRNCTHDGSGSLGMTCSQTQVEIPHIDRMVVKMRTQISLKADNEPDRFHFVVDSQLDNDNGVLPKVCDTGSCVRLSTQSQYSQFSDNETPTSYRASSFSINKLESLRQVFIFLSEGDRIAHKTQIELIR
jgi:hypothetical protein